MTQVLPPDDRPPARTHAHAEGDWWYFAVIGVMAVFTLIAQAFVFALGRDEVWIGCVGAALAAVWLYANTQDVSKWQANPGPTDRGIPPGATQ